MSTVKKGELFVKEVIARLKGDDAEVLASKIGRKAISAVDMQIAALRGAIVEKEIVVEDAREALKTAKYPTEVFTDSKQYCANIVKAQSVLDAAEQDLEDVKDSLEYFEGIAEGF